MKNLFLFILIGMFTVACSSQNKQEKSTWEDFVSKQANFKVKVPCKLQETIEPARNQPPRSGKSYNHFCINDENKIYLSFTEYLTAGDKEQTLQNLPYIPGDLKATFPNIETIDTEKIIINGNVGNISDNKLSNKDKVKSFNLVGERGFYNAVIYIPRKINQTDNDFGNYYKSITERIVESFEIIKM